MSRLPRPAKIAILATADAGLGVLAFWCAVIARTGALPILSVQSIVYSSAVALTVVPIVALTCGLYQSVIRFQLPALSWRYALVSLISGLLIMLLGAAGGAKWSQSLGLAVVFGLFLFLYLTLSRQIARLALYPKTSSHARPVAIFGAGSAGLQLSAMLRRSREYRVALFIDDDRALGGRTVEDVPVVVASDGHLANKLSSRGVTEVLLAIPSLSPSGRRRVLERLSGLALHVRTIPGLDELMQGGDLSLSELREVSTDELLGRDPVPPLPGLREKCVRGKVVLVTGGGGSIGRELCRQVSQLGPEMLVVLDHSELALYEVERWLRSVVPKNSLPKGMQFVLGSVADRVAVDALFERYKPDTVYHAAAYKHVPIIEAHPSEGLRNNVLGTWYVADAAARSGTSHFILISTDKAVRPANVMGATKRMAELAVQMLADSAGRTVFSMVRFGNVLGSSGSVVPLFQEQISRGGPVTLTHPDVTRYFMTISEAVELVIQAGGMAGGGEVFVLDMGEPVKIRSLAERMIGLSGHTVRDERNPEGDIAIEIVGLRAGEKLYEELLISGERTATAHPRVWQVREEGADWNAYADALRAIEAGLVRNAGRRGVPETLARWVTGYRRAQPNGAAEQTAAQTQGVA